MNWFQFHSKNGTCWVNLDNVSQAYTSATGGMTLDMIDRTSVIIRAEFPDVVDSLKARLIILAERSTLCAHADCDCPRCRDESAEIGGGT